MPLSEKILTEAGWMNIKIKMNIVLGVLLVATPLVILVTAEPLTKTEVVDQLGLWVIAGLILLYPLSSVLTNVLFLIPIRQLNGLCLEIQNGNLNPFNEIPPEPEKRDELQKLRHNMFWMGHVIGKRQKELKHTLAELSTSQEQMKSSLDYAQLIQKAFLPSKEDFRNYFANSFLLWKQRDGVGGDSCWLKKSANGFFVAVIDCTGHGVPGAFMTLIVNSLLDRIDVTKYEDDPAGLLARMNVLIKKALSCSETRVSPDDGMDCTFLFVNRSVQTLTFSGARNYLFVRKLDGSIDEYRGDRMGVGNNSTPDDAVFTNTTVPFEHGYRMYMFTDGITDQIGGEHHLPFGRKRIRRVIANKTYSMEKQEEVLSEMFLAYQGTEERRDDVLLLGAEL
ncbi:MAG: SpoIIE family protein phosphatase [Desulfovibrionales bacterium]|nr:SpoIIE family protein phosphatase [Desulfovibrionales bacterium]